MKHFLVLAVFLVASTAAAQESADAWTQKMAAGRQAMKSRAFEEGARLYGDAVTLAGTSERAADSLCNEAQAFEAAFKRADAIAAWKRLAIEHPDSTFATRACFRLGELYRSITLLPPGAPEAEQRKTQAEMTTANARPWFEAAVAHGGRYDQYSISSKHYLVGIYAETGRQAEALALLRELSSLDPEKESKDKSAPAPSQSDPGGFLAMSRRRAAQKLVDSVMVPGDTAASIAALNAVAAELPGTDAEVLARAKVKELSRQEASQSN